MEHMLLRATNIAILNNKKKTAQQLIGNGRGSFGLIGTIAVGYGPPAAKLLLGNCVHMSIEKFSKDFTHPGFPQSMFRHVHEPMHRPDHESRVFNLYID